MSFRTSLCVIAGLMIFVASCRAKTVQVPAPPPLAYPETADGLKQMIEEILAATKEKDTRKVDKLVARMILPDHEAWFRKTFGDKLGGGLGADYGGNVGRMKKELPAFFKKLVDAGRTKVWIERFARGSTGGKVLEGPLGSANKVQSAAINAMKTPAVLYTVWMEDSADKGSTPLWSFVYSDGCFRIGGRMEFEK